MEFEKSPLSHPSQIALLKRRNLLILDQERAEKYLKHIGYYRLSAYMVPFYKNRALHEFHNETTFDDVLNLYLFDRKLRLHLLEAIERIEISCRAHITDTLALQLGQQGYTKRDTFNDRYNHHWLLEKIQKEMYQSSEAFVAHYRKKYTASKYPPIWMATQLLTFKEISLLYGNIRSSEITAEISEHYGLKDVILKSWMRCLSDLRNLCAHHSRVWNKNYGVMPKLPKKRIKHWISERPGGFKTVEGKEIDPCRSLYLQIAVIWKLMYAISPKSTWFERFKSLCQAHEIDCQSMGFPPNWHSDPFWCLNAKITRTREN